MALTLGTGTLLLLTLALAGPIGAEDAVLAERLGRRAPGRPTAELLATQALDYDAVRAKTVIDLQKFRRSASMPFPGPKGGAGVATLIDLNPRVNSWYLLHVRWPKGRETWHHLINPRPALQVFGLDAAHPSGIVVIDARGQRACALWPADDVTGPLGSAKRSPAGFASVCDGAVLLPIPAEGSRTTKEWAADFLRDHVPGGEKLTVLVRKTLFKDTNREIGRADADLALALQPDDPALPRAAQVDPSHRSTALAPGELGIAFDGDKALAGKWYRVSDASSVFVSVMQAGLVAPEILAGHTKLARSLDAVESGALAYLVAFDLEAFDVGFALGTDHPRVSWSERARGTVKVPGLPGPDGIGDVKPLVTNGRVPADVTARTVATFVGGFKRQHGAFRGGALANVNGGSHYGFIQNGAVLSKLSPGVATVFMLDDGRLDLKTWQRDDDALLSRVRFARQNGVAIVETAEDGEPAPGALVSAWSDGNWSGSQVGKLRTVRSALAIQETPTRRFLVYAYFSSATPSAMARVLQSYSCRYAMPLDMNALEHTYFALYHWQEAKLEVEHLVTGMDVLEKTKGDSTVLRFLGYADNRDFFYVTRREPPAAAANGTSPR